MANALYDSGRQKFLEGSIAWLTDTIKIALVKAAYTPNLATHDFYDDVSANVTNTPQTLGGKSSTSGVAAGSNVTFTSVTNGDVVTYVLIYKDSGVAGTSPVIGLIDTASGLPVTANGGDISVNWDTGANKIFKL